MHAAQATVRAWHRSMGDRFPLPGEAAIDVTRNAQLRYDLIEEELNELHAALADEDEVEVADALADLLFVIYGAADTWGIDIEPVWDEVVRSNNSKIGGPVREDGKRLKPEWYSPPDIAGVLARTHGGTT